VSRPESPTGGRPGAARRARAGLRPAGALVAALSAVLLVLTAAPAQARPASTCNSVRSTSISPSVLRGGDGATQTVTLDHPALATDDFITLRNGGDYAYGRTEIKVPVGQRSVSFPIRFDAPNRIVVYRLIEAYGCVGLPQQTNAVTVRPLDPAKLAVQSVNLPRDAINGQTVTATLHLTAPARPTGTTARIIDYGGLDLHGRFNWTVPAGQTSVSYPVRVIGVERPGSLALVADLGTSTGVGWMFVVPDHLAVTPQVGVSGSSRFIVGLGARAPAGGARVAVTVHHPDVHAPAYVTVPQGQVGASFPLTVDEYPNPRDGTITVSRGGATDTEPFTFE